MKGISREDIPCRACGLYPNRRNGYCGGCLLMLHFQHKKSDRPHHYGLIKRKAKRLLS